MRDTDMRPDLAPTDPLEAGAWAACLKWACGHTDVIDRYRLETGDTYDPSLSHDPAGQRNDLAFVEHFVRWFNANVWGDLNATEAKADGAAE